MKIYKQVHSSNLQFKSIEVNVDTVYIRYNECKWVEDEIWIGWIYDEEQYTLREFTELQEQKIMKLDNTLFPVPDKTNIDNYKSYLINQSKLLLRDYLENSPLLFNDGQYYSVTENKQSLLNNAIAVYQLKIQSGIENPSLKWNSTGDECTEWTIENITLLALSIANYVEPLVAKQQAIEVNIKACTSIEELDNVVIDYGTI